MSTRIETATRIGGAGLVVLALSGLALFVPRTAGDELRDLERADEANRAVGTTGERIHADLLRIAGNLRAGALLSEKSAEIHSLTERQRRSLQELSSILRPQIAHVRTGAHALRGAKRSSADIVSITRRQRRLLARTLDALRTLRGFAAESATTSSRLSRSAQYGARLAEDSEDSFSTP